jgi:DNA processing protein
MTTEDLTVLSSIANANLVALLSISGMTARRLLTYIQNLHRRGVTVESIWGQSDRKYFPQSWNEELIQQVKDFQHRWPIEGYMYHLQELGILPLLWRDPEYPELLQQISDFPPLLFTRGNWECLKPIHVAIVGSRRPTRYGQWVTQQLVSGLVQHNISIVSGFMVGIDYQAHQTTQTVGGRSIGVLGFGFGRFYPRYLSRSAEEFLADGNLLMTEYPPGIPPHPGHFPARNRIVAGLAKMTVVVEAQEKSGSLITAQCALENGRSVGAIPGPVDSIQSAGTHNLLRQGAVLIRTGEDVWEEISGLAVPG